MNHPLLRTCTFSIILLLSACQPPKTVLNQPTDTIAAKQCTAHPFLEKYGCSMITLEQSAENGDADAAYALGYVYYYGISTDVDHQSAKLWIQRAANQQQPLALAALKMINNKNQKMRLQHTTPHIITQKSHSHHSKIKHQPATSNRISDVRHPQPISLTQKNTRPRLVRKTDASQPIKANKIKRTNQYKARLLAKSGYTIQLMASKNRSTIEHIRLTHPKEPLKTVQNIDRGEVWNILLYGQFKSYRAAHQAIISMNPTLKRQNPWVRRLSSIHPLNTHRTK